jgi:hypothetical protein
MRHPLLDRHKVVDAEPQVSVLTTAQTCSLSPEFPDAPCLHARRSSDALTSLSRREMSALEGTRTPNLLIRSSPGEPRFGRRFHCADQGVGIASPDLGRGLPEDFLADVAFSAPLKRNATSDKQDNEGLRRPQRLGVRSRRAGVPARGGGYWRSRWEERRQPKDTSAKDRPLRSRRSRTSSSGCAGPCRPSSPSEGRTSGRPLPRPSGRHGWRSGR